MPKYPCSSNRRVLVERKKLCVIVVGLFSIAFILNGCMTPEEPGRYYNRDFGFSITFPAGWEIRTMENGWVTLAVTEFEGPDDLWAEAVVVDVYERQLGFDLDNIFNEEVNKMVRDAEKYYEEDRGEVTIDGERARWILYTYYFSEVGDMKVIEYFLVKGKRAYFISGDASIDRFSDFEEIFISSARSFRFE
jgi:hypothetical protein